MDAEPVGERRGADVPRRTHPAHRAGGAGGADLPGPPAGGDRLRRLAGAARRRCPRSARRTRGWCATPPRGGAPPPATPAPWRPRARCCTGSTATCWSSATTSRPSCAGTTRSTTRWCSATSGSSTRRRSTASIPAVVRTRGGRGPRVRLVRRPGAGGARLGRGDVRPHRRPERGRAARPPRPRRRDRVALPGLLPRGRRHGPGPEARRGLRARLPARRVRRRLRARPGGPQLAPRARRT